MAKSHLKKVIIIMVACFIYASGVSLFLDPNNLAPGGVTGISIIINRLTGISTGNLIFIINIPIMLLGLWKFGKKHFGLTIFNIFFISLFTNLLESTGAVTKDPFLAAMAGSSMVAIGVGLIFRCGGTTGGTDIIVKLLRLKYPHIKSGSLFLMTDLVIVAISGFIFQNINAALYAAAAVMVCSYVMDMVLYGPDEATLIYIISGQAKQIAGRLMEEAEIGVTYLQGEGAYLENEKKIIMCVMKKAKSAEVEEIIKKEDPGAFIIVTSAREIYGEGYKDLYGEKL